MHEMSIAQNIVDIIREHVAPDKETSVRSIKMKIGEFSGVVKESLEFCFASLIQNTPLSKASLEIENVPIKASCNMCKNLSALEYGVFICPLCGSNDVKLLSGTELHVETIEIDEEGT
jgi:hydrogenase nickel incorporation protein HypA/HybF